jgi:predicted nicotinamide N-methyase
VKGLRVLDFGAGCGVAGIAAARAGASAVTATELDANAVLAMDLNARLNGVTLDPVLLDVVERQHGCDVIVAADVCYDEEASRTMRWLHAQARLGVIVLLADAGRGFLNADGLTHLATFTVPTHPDLEDAATRKAHVYRVG